VNIKVSEIKLALTEVQYGMLMALSQSIPRILGVPEGSVQAEPTESNRGVVERFPVKPEPHNVDLRPELDGHLGSTHPRTTLDLVFTVKTVKLQLFDRQATTEASLKDHGIARFALSDNSVRVKTLSDGAMEAQVVLRSFTMSNTTPAPSKFREIIPAAQDDRNQFMLLYTSTGGSERSSLVVLTVDSPHIIFSLAPVFALMEFFTSAFEASDLGVDEIEVPKALGKANPNPAPDEQAIVQFRIDLHDVSISVLENDLDSDSQAIRLTVAQISVSQQACFALLMFAEVVALRLIQGILALSMTRAGMALLRMGRPEEARILDDVDLTLTLDNRTLSLQQMTSVDMAFKPIVLRASYRDIMLILTIVNKAIDAYGKQTSVSSTSKPTRPSLEASTAGASRISGGPTQGIVSNLGQPSNQLLGTAHVVLSKEQVRRETSQLNDPMNSGLAQGLLRRVPPDSNW
jgi:vacuolar protein sorting-associated protein 13A/C